MDTIMEQRAGTADLEGLQGARWNSSRLTGASDEIARHIRLQPDITLGELGAALVGVGFTWSPEGRLAYEPRHVALIDEIEGLIEIHGWGTRAAKLLL